MMNLAEYRNRTGGLADYLPWAALAAPGVVLNKDGSLQHCALPRSGPRQRDTNRTDWNNGAPSALRRLGSVWAIFVEAQRSSATAYPDSTFPEAAPALVDLERREQFEAAGIHFESRYYLTFLWMPPAEDASRAENWPYEGREQTGVNAQELLRGFIDRTDRVLQLFERFLCRRSTGSTIPRR